MRFTGGEHIPFAGCSDPTGILAPDAIYECRMEEHSWHTRIYIAGIQGKYFNSVLFEYVDRPGKETESVFNRAVREFAENHMRLVEEELKAAHMAGKCPSCGRLAHIETLANYQYWLIDPEGKQTPTLRTAIGCMDCIHEIIEMVKQIQGRPL